MENKMKKINLFITVLLFVPFVSFGQEYYVSAKGGLNVREAPDAKAKKIETLLYGQKVTVESETGIKLTINDFDQRSGDTKIIEGEWVKIEYAKTFYTIPGDGDIYSNPYEIKKYEGYIFNGFLKEASFPQYIDENYIDFNSMDNIYLPKGTVVYFNEDDKDYESNPSIIEYFKDVEKPKSLTSCYKYKSGILFSGIAYDIILSDPFYEINPINYSPKKYKSGPKIDIYIAEFKNGVLTGKQKKINPLEGIETEKIKIIGIDQIGVEKEIVVKYSDLTIEFGDLQEYVYVNDVAFFDLDGNRISDFPPFNFWVNNRESFLFDMNNKNKFLKIKYFPEYIEPKGEYGIQDKIHFFDSDCNLYDIVKEVEVIEDFNVKVKSYKNLLIGKWQSTDDENNFVEFTKDARIETYGDYEDTERYSISNSCKNGGEIESNEDNYISGWMSELCWYIISVDDKNLSLSYVGRGNTLNYKRIN
jgi:hypothetical protein